MEYLSAVAAGLTLAAVAAALSYFFKTLEREHSQTLQRLPRTDPRHHRWLHQRRERRATVFGSRALVRR